MRIYLAGAANEVKEDLCCLNVSAGSFRRRFALQLCAS